MSIQAQFAIGRQGENYHNLLIMGNTFCLKGSGVSRDCGDGADCEQHLWGHDKLCADNGIKSCHPVWSRDYKRNACCCPFFLAVISQYPLILKADLEFPVEECR